MYCSKIVCEPKAMVNGLDANGFDQHEMTDEAVAVSPFLPPPVPPSSVQGSPVPGANWRDNSCLTMSPQCTWAAGANGTPPHTAGEDPSEAAGMAMEATVSSSGASPVAATSTATSTSSSDSSADDGSDGEPAHKRIKLSDDHSTEEEANLPTEPTRDSEPVIAAENESSDTSAPLTSETGESDQASSSSPETEPEKDKQGGDEIISETGVSEEEKTTVAKEEEEEMEAEGGDTEQEQCCHSTEESEHKSVEEEKEAAAARREESLAGTCTISNPVSSVVVSYKR